jgi:hypothetical protein
VLIFFGYACNVQARPGWTILSEIFAENCMVNMSKKRFLGKENFLLQTAQ